MKLVWGNSFDGTNNYMAYEKKRMEKEADGSTGMGALNNPFINRNGLAAQKAETKLREMEDKMMEEYRRQITEVEGSTDPAEVKAIKIEGLTEKIKLIEEARVQREQEALTRELEKKKSESEKQKKSRELNKAEDGGEEFGLSHEDIEGMVKMSVSHESLRELKRTKAMLKSEAKQLEIDISNDSFTIMDDFKHTQLNKLGKGISGLESSIASEVRKMAKNAEELTEERVAREDVSNEVITSDSEADDEKKDSVIDIAV